MHGFIMCRRNLDTCCDQCPTTLYTSSDVITTLRRSGKVNGILIPVLNDTDTPDHLSPDQSCPNVGSGKSLSNTITYLCILWTIVSHLILLSLYFKNGYWPGWPCLSKGLRIPTLINNYRYIALILLMCSGYTISKMTI